MNRLTRRATTKNNLNCFMVTIAGFLLFASTVGALPANPSIQANGMQGSIVLAPGQALTLSVSLVANEFSGRQGDWWFVEAQGADFRSFNLATGAFQAGLTPTFQGSFFDLPLTPAFTDNNPQLGSYTYYFAVDGNPNGVVDADVAFDLVTVEIGGAFALMSSAFENGQMIPAVHSCDGLDISPRLRWANLPANTRNLALAVIDIDAPGGNFHHWLVVDIPVTSNQLPENVLPGDLPQFINDFGLRGWRGPCPPPFDQAHRYIFRLYALDSDPPFSVSIDAPIGQTIDLLNTTAVSTDLMGLYDR